MHDSKKFDRLIGDVNLFVESLEKITEGSRREQEQVLDGYLSHLRSPPARQLLADAESSMPFGHAADTISQGEDTPLNANNGASEGHTYLRLQVLGEGRALNGNVDSSGGFKNIYRDSVVSGQAKVVNGNTSGAFAADFFK